jgi:hypothetical protein
MSDRSEPSWSGGNPNALFHTVSAIAPATNQQSGSKIADHALIIGLKIGLASAMLSSVAQSVESGLD